MAGASRDDIMQLAEGVVGHVVQQVVAHLPGELESLGRDASVFADLLSESFERRPHADAVADLHGMGHNQSPDAEIDWAGRRCCPARRASHSSSPTTPRAPAASTTGRATSGRGTCGTST